MFTRKNWIDWVKVWGIWLVTIGHGGLVNEWWTQFIFSFHMPLFFILSGYLFKPLSFKERLKKDFYSLIVPYFLMNGIRFLIWLVVSVLRARSGNEILESALQHGSDILLGIPMSGPTWFLLALFWVRLVANGFPNKTIVYSGQDNGGSLSGNNTWCNLIPSCLLFQKICHFMFRNKRSISVVSMFLLLGYLLSLHQILFYFAINSAIMSLPFFIAGIWMKSVRFSKSLVWLSVCLAITLIVNGCNGRVNAQTFDYGRNILLYYVAGFSGSLMFFLFCQFMDGVTNRFVRVISAGTILIMGFNLIAIDITKKFVSFIFPVMNMNSAEGMIIGSGILVLFYPFIIFSSKYIPLILGNRNVYKRRS